MEARLLRAIVAMAALGLMGANYRSPNFIITAPTPQMAEQVGTAAETFRRDLATLWLGKPMPNWSQPCPITVQLADGAGGATSFVFDQGEVFGWQMNVQGSLERILDSVLPHEVTHTIFASHFRRPLPRWADEGACTTVEHTSERTKQQKMLVHFLKNNRGIPFSQMLVMKEYPHDVMPLYSQGHSLVSFLIGQGGRQKFLNFVAAGMEQENWTDATRQFYAYSSLSDLQNQWLTWVRQGSPMPPASAPQVAAQTEPPAPATLRPRPDPSLYAGANSGVKVIAAGPLVPLSPPEPVDARWRRAGSKDVTPGPAQLAASDGAATPIQPGISDPNAVANGSSNDPSRQVILEWSRTAPKGQDDHANGAASVANSMDRPSVYDARANPGSATRRF